MATATGLLLLQVLLFTAVLPAQLHAQSTDHEMRTKLTQFLKEYADFKGYKDKRPEAAEARLNPSQRRTLYATLRALFTPILPQVTEQEQKTQRLIDFVTAITGIWGVRRGNSEGKHQFRLSVKFDLRLWNHLRDSDNFVKSEYYGHVLLPKGDDDPLLDRDQFKLRTDGVVTYRQTRGKPALQLSYLKAEPEIGEVDIDFDPITIWNPLSYIGPWSDHDKPSNSDPGAVDGNHSHLESFNMRYNFFTTRLKLNYQDTENHGKSSYVDVYYEQ